MTYEMRFVYFEIIKGMEFVKGASCDRVRLNNQYDIHKIIENPVSIESVKEQLQYYREPVQVRLSNWALIR